jgi:internalin A
VEIPDPGLQAAVREALAKPDGPISVVDMESLTELSASRRDIQSIAGLESARNRRRLDLDPNQLTRLSLPAELAGLESLNVGFILLTNVSLPPGMTNLYGLYLGPGGNRLIEAPPLETLTGLDAKRKAGRVARLSEAS